MVIAQQKNVSIRVFPFFYNKFHLNKTVMTKILLSCLLYLSVGLSTYAQQLKQYSNIKIGEKVPDVTIANIHNYTSASVKISDFKEKLLILDFWATWCSPCVAMLPKTDSLQRRFGEKVQFLPISYQPKAVVLSFLGRMQKAKNHVYNLPMVTDDKVLQQLFPHYGVPHYVWINKGEVIAITGHADITQAKINDILKGSSSNFKEKLDTRIDYDFNQPLLPVLTGSDYQTINRLQSYSAFSKYISGLDGGMFIDNTNTGNWRIAFRNTPLKWFYTYAFGEGRKFFQDSTIEVQVKDTSLIDSNLSGEPYVEWSKQNTYCFELSINDSIEANGYNIFRNELRNKFRQYDVKIVNKNKKCLVLEFFGTPDDNKLRTKGGDFEIKTDNFGYKLRNSSLDTFVMDLSWKYLSSAPPLVNNTGYKDKIDLDLDANISDVKSLNKALQKYGLYFVEKDFLVDILVIKDSNF